MKDPERAFKIILVLTVSYRHKSIIKTTPECDLARYTGGQSYMYR